MFNYIDRISLYLNPKIKNKVIFLIPLSLVSSLLEILSISMLVPILGYFVNLETFIIQVLIKFKIS